MMPNLQEFDIEARMDKIRNTMERPTVGPTEKIYNA